MTARHTGFILHASIYYQDQHFKRILPSNIDFLERARTGALRRRPNNVPKSHNILVWNAEIAEVALLPRPHCRPKVPEQERT